MVDHHDPHVRAAQLIDDQEAAGDQATNICPAQFRQDASGRWEEFELVYCGQDVLDGATGKERRVACDEAMMSGEVIERRFRPDYVRHSAAIRLTSSCVYVGPSSIRSSRRWSVWTKTMCSKLLAPVKVHLSPAATGSQS